VCRLTLEEARQRALANNKALALARLNVDEKQHAVNAARKDYFPKFLGNVTYLHFDQPLGTVLTAGGGRLGILPARTVSVNVLNQDTALSTILVAQPITKLIAVNALVQIARADETIAQAKLDQGTKDVLSGVSQVYYGLLGARRIQAALELQARLLEQLAAAKPAPELKIALLEVRQGLPQVKGQVRELTDQLNNLLDLPPCTVLELVDPVPPAPPVRCADEAVQYALASNAEVREAEQNIAKAEAALKIARMSCLPDVNVLGGYANQTGADYIQDNIGYVGLTATHVFWEWGKRKDVKLQRQSQIALAHQNLLVTRDKVQLEARKTYGAFEQALETYRLAEEMVQARKEAEQGAAGPVAVMTAKGETAKAELEYMQAEIAYRVAHAKLMGVICSE
jgi:outer membrane protein TolC